MEQPRPGNGPRQAAGTAARDENVEENRAPKPATPDWSYRPGGTLTGMAAPVSGGDSGHAAHAEACGCRRDRPAAGAACLKKRQ